MTVIESGEVEVSAFPLDTPIFFTAFDNVNAATKTAGNKPWGQVAESFESPELYTHKGAQPLIKFALFGDKKSIRGSLREDSNMGASSAIEIDYDDGKISIDEAAALFRAAGIEAVLHSTARSAPDFHRWRAICPFKLPRQVADRAEYVALINGALGGIAAGESFNASQSYFFGAIKGLPYEFRHVRGHAIDDGPDLFLTSIYKAGKPKIYESSLLDELPDTVTDEAMRHVSQCVACLKPERADDYQTWLAALFHLKHLAWCGREQEAEALARAFSMRSSKFDERYFSAKWRKLPVKGHFKTLFVLAEQDGWKNPLKSGAPTLIDMTDTGNVNAMADITDGNLRFVHGAGSWMYWRDSRWTIDLAAINANTATQQVAEMYRTRARQKAIEADEATTPADKKMLLKLEESYKSWANYCRNRRGIDALLTLAARDQRFVIYQDALDSNRYLLGVDNGVVDLHTGALRQSARDDAITKRSPYAYLQSATAPRFLQFIAEITSQPIDEGNTAGLMRYRARPHLAGYVQRALGYMLTGSVSEQKMFIASGPGANGKSILFDVIEKIMGPYCVRMPPEALMASARDGDAERPTPFARSVAGARLVITSEAKEGQKLNAALVKRQTGDAKLTARGMRENAYTFDVTHKLVLLTNHHPELDQADDAIRGRLHIIPFDRTWNRPGVPVRNPRLEDGDKHLMQTLEGEAEGILAWLVQGAVAYFREGLEPPREVVAVTSAYLHEQDAFGRWLEEMEPCEIRAGAGASELLELFQTWCMRHGVSHPTPNNATAFGKGLSARSIPKGRTVSGIVYGLRPRDGDLF